MLGMYKALSLLHALKGEGIIILWYACVTVQITTFSVLVHKGTQIWKEV